MPQETDYAWAAGFFDGEGNIFTGFRGSFKRPRSVMQVAQVNREPLDRLQKILGGGSVLGPYVHKNPNSQDYYVWRCEAGPILLELKDKLYKYLTTPKREQIDRAIQEKEKWEMEGVCSLGHRLTKDKTGRYRCPNCQAEQGRKNANARWNKPA